MDDRRTRRKHRIRVEVRMVFIHVVSIIGETNRNTRVAALKMSDRSPPGVRSAGRGEWVNCCIGTTNQA
jgi:hypothetical protein